MHIYIFVFLIISLPQFVIDQTFLDHNHDFYFVVLHLVHVQQQVRATLGILFVSMTIHILVRHCFYSEASARKGRPADFDRKRIFETLLQSLTPQSQYDLTVVLDSDGSKIHFTQVLQEQYALTTPYEIQIVYGGSEMASFRNCLQIASKKGWPMTDTVVFLEDDYLVTQDWLPLIEEGLLYAPYATLYDHPDKYSAFMYPNLLSKLFLGVMRHWRTTPSTTNSYACKVRTLLEDLNIHLRYSDGMGVTNDHQKFLQLWAMDRSLVSCIPGAWSHEEVGMQSRIM